MNDEIIIPPNTILMSKTDLNGIILEVNEAMIQFSEFTREEAEILDLSLILHAEHGGGNNSTFKKQN